MAKKEFRSRVGKINRKLLCMVLLLIQGTAACAASQTADPMQIKSPVTIEFRNAPIKDVLRMLAQAKQLNLFIDASVPDAKVTLSFKDVPFNEAIDCLLRANGLAYVVNGRTLVVGTRENIGKTMRPGDVVKGYKMAYAIADDGKLNESVAAVLSGMFELSKPPVADARTRTLYVSATPERHAEIERMIAQIDRPGKQVMIHAQIVEVSEGARRELETLVSGIYDRWLASFSAAGLNAGYYYSNVVRGFVDPNYPLAGTNPPRDGLGKVMLQTGQKTLSAGIGALEINGNAKVLANPSVIAIDGHKASIRLTHKYKYPSGIDSNGNTTFSDQEVGPKLDFTPVIGRDGIITLNVKIETGAIVRFRQAGYNTEVPETANRSVETVVRVHDAEPFVVGGLFEETANVERNRIPVIGYIPYLGDMFSYKTDNRSKSEVAMIVIPYILDVPEGEPIEKLDLSPNGLTD